MIGFYKDTFACVAAREQPLFDMEKVGHVLDGLLDTPDDKRVAVEGILQRAASVIVMKDKFGLG